MKVEQLPDIIIDSEEHLDKHAIVRIKDGKILASDSNIENLLKLSEKYKDEDIFIRYIRNPERAYFYSIGAKYEDT